MKQGLPQLRIGQNLFLVSLWVGIVLSIAGLSIRLISDVWSTLAIALLIVGLLAIACILLLRWRFGPPSQSSMSWWRRRSLQTTANAIIATSAVVILLTIGNIMAVRFGKQVDLTEAKQYSLAPQTQEVLRQLEQPLKVWSFTETPDPDERTLLERFQQLNPEKFQFEFVNPQLQPGIANRFKITVPDKVVLDYKDRSRTIDRPFDEADITPALVSLVGDIEATLYFLEGHGEVPLAGSDVNLESAAAALNKANFTLSPLNLIQQPTVPEDADALIIAGPKRKLVESELNAIRTFLEEGGRLLTLLDPELQTGLEPLLQEWGITLDNRIIVDVSPSGESLQLGPAVPVVVDYSDHPIANNFAQGFSYYPLAQALKIDETTDSVTPFLFSQERTWAESTPDSEELEFDPAVDLQGPLTIGVAVDGAATDPDQETETTDPSPESSSNKSQARLVVIGDSDFATSGPFEQGVNGDVFLNSVSWLADNQMSLSIRAKEQVERRLDLSPTYQRLLAVVAVVILPLFAFAIAGTVWWKRR